MKKISKLLSVVLCIAMLMSLALAVSAESSAPTIADGEYVIYAPAYNKALSAHYPEGDFYNSGVDVSGSVASLSGYASTEIWTVTNNDDGTITISYDGQNLGMQDKFSSMTLGAVNDKWVLEDAGDGLVYVKNVVRNCYVEWYDSKNYWSAYSKINSGSEGMFALAFVPYVEDEAAVDYYVAGYAALCGSDWDPDDTANLMSKGEDGLYTKTYKYVPAGTYELKVTIGNWNTSWGQDGQNYKFTTESYSNVTVIFDAEKEIVSVETEALPIVPISTALSADKGDFAVKGVVTLIDGSNLYVQDATGGICVRMKSAPEGVSLGDTVIGVGSRSDYNGLPQLQNSVYEKSEGVALAAKDTTIDAMTTDDLCTYIKLCGVEVTDVDDNDGVYSQPNITVTDGTNTIQIYKAVVDKNEDGTWAIAVGDKIDVLAAVSCYKTTLQLRNTIADEITVVVDETENGDDGDDDFSGGSSTPELVSKYRVTGSGDRLGNWDPSSEVGLMYDDITEGIHSVSFQNLPAGEYQFKITQGSWDMEHWGGNGPDGNYVFELDEMSTVTIIFNETTSEISVFVGGEEIPKTGDMNVAALVVAMMTATAGAVVIGKKKF